MPIPAVVRLVAPIIGKLLGKFLKNKGEKAKAMAEIELALASQETKLIEALSKSDVAQADINKEDAKSGKFWQAGWRPSLAWCCVLGFAWNILLPVASWGLKLAGMDVPEVPTIGGEMLTSMTFGILGLGAYRTYEKKNGVSK